MLRFTTQKHRRTVPMCYSHYNNNRNAISMHSASSLTMGTAFSCAPLEMTTGSATKHRVHKELYFTHESQLISNTSDSAMVVATNVCECKFDTNPLQKSLRFKTVTTTVQTMKYQVNMTSKQAQSNFRR